MYMDNKKMTVEGTLLTVGSAFTQLQQSISWRDAIIYAIIGCVSWYLYKLLIRPLLSPLRKIPGCQFIPIVGNMLEARKYEAMTNCIRWMTMLNSKIIRFYYFGGQERILVGDPDVFNQVLVTNSKFYRRVGGITTGPLQFLFRRYPPLFSLSGGNHHIVRKLCNPAFSLKALHGMLPVFVERTQALIKGYKLSMGGNSSSVVTIQTDLAKLTLDVICKCGFGYELNAVENSDKIEVTRFKRLSRNSGASFFNLIPFANKLPLKKNREMREDAEYIVNLTKQVLQQKREQLENQGEQGHRDLLTSLLIARDEEDIGMSDEALFSQVTGFMFAGFETTSIGMTWTLLQLAQYPEVQAKLRQEVASVLKQTNGQITSEALDDMKYMSCVIKETLRLFPPVTCIFRQAIKEDNFKGYDIPAGTVVGLHIGSLHRLNWEDGDKFRPERFLSATDKTSHKLLPFSVGPYMCIGSKFSMTEMKTVLALLLNEFEFSMKPGYTYRRVQSIVLQPSPVAQLVISPVFVDGN